MPGPKFFQTSMGQKFYQYDVPRIAKALEAMNTKLELITKIMSIPNENMPKETIRDCPDCAAPPGTPHQDGCDVQRCSVCGGQKLSCDCADHDPVFARWSGWWPGTLESAALGIDLNEFYRRGLNQIVFIKPKPRI